MHTRTPADAPAPRHLTGPAPAPAHWPFGPLTPHQRRRRAAQEDALRTGAVARWPQGLPHLDAWGVQ